MFTAAAILTFALGIGANTAIFSIIDEALFRPLDFPKPEQLVDVFAFNKATRKYLSSSYPDYADLRDRTRTFQELSAFVRMPMNVEFAGRSERLPVEAVTGNFFPMLELAPASGRAFREDEERVAMVSEEIADMRSIGARISIEGEPFTIVGLVPRRYHGTNLNWGDPPRVWIPLRATAIVQPRFQTIDIFHRRTAIWLLMTGRLKPGIGVATAQAEMRTIAAGMNRDLTAVVLPASRSKFWPSYRDSVARSLTVFAVAAALLLILTCANLSNLLLTRAIGRRREFAIRLSIGARKGRLLRQLLTETIFLAAPGCMAALAVAYGLGRILVKFPNALGLPLALDATIEPRVLIFCMALSLAASLIFGLAPALRATRTEVLPALKDSGNTVSTRSRSRQVLIAVQVAFSVVLLIGGGLFVRSVMSAWSIDPGFRAQGLLTAEFSFPATKAGTERMRQGQKELLARLHATPGVTSVTAANEAPFGHIMTTVPAEAPGQTFPAELYDVAPDFFGTLGIQLLKGRDFSDRDDASAPQVAVVSQSLAASLWPGGDPIGQVVTIRKREMRVVGVVAGARYSSVWDDAPAAIYSPIAQENYPANDLIVRVNGDPAALAGAVNREWSELMPRSPLYNMRTGEELLKTALAPQRMAAGIFGSFGLLAIMLASVGLYSAMAYLVASRTREIGLRIAIGAGPSDIARAVVGGALRWTMAGIAGGVVLSLASVRYASGQVKGVSVYDAGTFVAVILVHAAVAAVAAAIPARRAMRVDPQTALRAE